MQFEGSQSLWERKFHGYVSRVQFNPNLGRTWIQFAPRGSAFRVLGSTLIAIPLYFRKHAHRPVREGEVKTTFAFVKHVFHLTKKKRKKNKKKGPEKKHIRNQSFCSARPTMKFRSVRREQYRDFIKKGNKLPGAGVFKAAISRYTGKHFILSPWASFFFYPPPRTSADYRLSSQTVVYRATI